MSLMNDVEYCDNDEWRTILIFAPLAMRRRASVWVSGSNLLI